MEQFFVRVLTAVITSEAVKAMLQSFVDKASENIKKDVVTIVGSLGDEINDLEKNAINNIDAMDGKMGNLQEQLTGMPGQIVTSVTTAVENAVRSFNPFKTFGG